MKLVLIFAVVALSANQALAGIRVLRAADHEGTPHVEPEAAAEHQEGHSEKPGPAALLTKALILLEKSHPDDAALKEDITAFQTHMKNGDFQGILEKVKIDLKGQEVNLPNLFKSFKEHSEESEHKELIHRIGERAKMALESIRAKHDDTAARVEKGLAAAVENISKIINPSPAS